MGSKYPVLKPRKVITTLEKVGFTYKSQRGSHVKYERNGQSVIIPMHNEIAKGTLKSILIQAEIELDDFLRLL